MKAIRAQQSSKKAGEPGGLGHHHASAFDGEQEHDVVLTVPDDAAKQSRYYSEQSDFSLQSSDKNSKGSGPGARHRSQALSTSSGRRQGSKGSATAAKEAEGIDGEEFEPKKAHGGDAGQERPFAAEVLAPALRPDMPINQEQSTPRKLSMDEKEFDNRLCNQVDQLLLTTSESINARNRKIAVEDYGSDRETKKKMKPGQGWKGICVNSDDKEEDHAKTAQKKKKKKGRKKNKNQYDQIDNFKLRSRTETPSKEVSICMVASQ